METQRAAANGIEIAYETFGDPGGLPLLLVMGLGTQMIAWPDDMCADLAVHGHYVVRFDNRDIGLSTHMAELRAPHPLAVALRRAQPPYTLADMADDAFALMTALGWDSAHVVGASMGGFIAQTMAIRDPARVRSLTLIMTSTGSRRVGNPKPAMARRLLRRRPVVDRESAVALSVDVMRSIGSPGYEFDEAFLVDLARRSYDRAYDPGGYLRQLAAISAQPDRTAALRRLRVPALVMHGLSDPLVAPSGGLALAKALRGSTFVGFPGMGHDLPRELWGRYAEAIGGLTSRAESAGRA